MLYRNLDETPLRASPFDKNPKGFVYRQTGTMYIFADEVGCVYSIFGWNRTDLYTKHIDNELTIKFKASGTPYEKYFICPDDYKPADNLDPNRCNIDGPLTRSKSYGSRKKLEEERKEDDKNIVQYLLIAAGIILVMILALFAFKCINLGKSKSATHSKKMISKTPTKLNTGKSSPSGTKSLSKNEFISMTIK